MTTMQDVAALAKVSAKTVSRVYNDDPHVDPETRARVQSAIQTLNYVPNTMARSFRAGRAAAVGVAVPDIADPFFAAIGRAVEDSARAAHMAVFVTSLGKDPGSEQEQVESLLGRQLSGLILAPVSADQSYLKRWATHTPIVFVDRPPNGVAADSFVDDDYGGAHAAVTHLVQRGHRRIAFIGDNVDIHTVADRLTGYRDALRDAGRSADDSLVISGVNDRTQARDAIVTLRSRKRPPTALFLSNARTAMACLPTLHEADAAPMAYLVFGDFPLADIITPTVTVVDQNAAQMGRQAIQRLLDRMSNPGRRYRRRTVLPVDLIERQSSTASIAPTSRT